MTYLETHPAQRVLELFGRSLAAVEAVRDNGDWLALPGMKQVINGILDTPRHAVVVLGAYEHVAVVAGNLSRPTPAVLVRVLVRLGNHGRNGGLVVHGQLEVGQIDGRDLDALEARLFLDSLPDKFGDMGPDAWGSSAASDDRNGLGSHGVS